jgi:hypothetical protein
MALDSEEIMETGGGVTRPADADVLAERKARIVRQGAYYRVAIVHGKAQLRQGMRPEAIFHRALGHAGQAVRARVDGLLHTGTGNVALAGIVPALVPHALKFFGVLSRRQLLRPALGIGFVLIAAGYLWQRRRQRSAPGAA